MSDKKKRSPRKLSSADVKLMELIDTVNLAPLDYKFSGVPPERYVPKAGREPPNERILKIIADELLKNLPKGKFGNMLRKINKDQGMDELLKVYGEIGTIKTLLDVETYWNEKMPPTYLMGRQYQMGSYIITTQVNGKFNFTVPSYLNQIKGSNVGMLRRCKYCGKIFLAPKKESQFCRPVNNRPSSCRNISNLKKFRKLSQNKKDTYKIARYKAEECKESEKIKNKNKFATGVK